MELSLELSALVIDGVCVTISESSYYIQQETRYTVGLTHDGDLV